MAMNVVVGIVSLWDVSSCYGLFTISAGRCEYDIFFR